MHALVTGIAISLRAVGILIIPISVIGIYCVHSKGEIVSNRISKIALYVLITLITTILAHPFLWDAPINNLIYYLKESSYFRWDGYVLFFSELIKANTLPLSYLPIWVMITTPILNIILFFCGLFFLIKELFQKKIKIKKEVIQDLVFLYFFATPFLICFLIKPVLYDGWRHFYFTYPALILIATKGVMEIIRIFKYSKFIIGFICINILLVNLLSVVKSHPNQDSYFNIIKKYILKKNFEIDYWGQSNVEALSYILNKNSKNQEITIASNGQIPIEPSVKFLNNKQN